MRPVLSVFLVRFSVNMTEGRMFGRLVGGLDFFFFHSVS